MRSHIRKWGNSLAIRIPWVIARDIGLARDAEVDIGARDGSLVVTPVKPLLADLEILVAGITPQNLPELADCGAPAGSEEW